jgi:RES domain-containing protein
MIIVRIALKKYATTLFAPGFAGRWNSEGKKVIYTAGSVSLATMENMTYRKGYGFNHDYAIMLIDLPDSLPITTYTADNLPKGWNDPFDYSVGQSVGDRWYLAMETPVLKVPSAVVPQEYNYVLHTLHPGFSKIKLIAVTGYVPDPRIEDILKNYPH